TPKGRFRPFVNTPYGHAVVSEWLPLFADFLRRELTENPPRGLRVGHLEPEQVAGSVLGPLFDGIFRGWEGRDSRSAVMLLKKTMGESLHGLDPDLEAGPIECVHDGNWLLNCAVKFGYVVFDENGFPQIAPIHVPHIARRRESLMMMHPVH